MAPGHRGWGRFSLLIDPGQALQSFDAGERDLDTGPFPPRLHALEELLLGVDLGSELQLS